MSQTRVREALKKGFGRVDPKRRRTMQAIKSKSTAPELAVRLGGWELASRTCVPEAPVDEESQSQPREDDIRATWESGPHSVAACALRPQCLAKVDFTSRHRAVRTHGGQRIR